MKLSYQLVLLYAFAGCQACAQQITPVIEVANPPNTAAQQAKHYVILVSLDGFRYDYPTKYGAPHLLAMAKDGASAPEGMLPAYPSLTFPNHLSIVTGLYPEHHGIVANSFFDPARNETYVYTQSKTNGDGSWYGGTPLWVLAEQQGMRSACLFWPGSEAEIQGKRPSYYLHYDDKLDDEKRVQQVLAWLRLPPELRPHFITLYYSNVDHAGHAYGPESDEVRAAVHHVDDMIGELQAGIAALKLPVDLVVVADHGMVTLRGSIDLSQFADLSNVHSEGSLLYAKDEAAAHKLYEQFNAASDARFSVYRREDVPRELHYDASPREGDPVIVPNKPYDFRTRAARNVGDTLHGGHGFDPRTMPEMKAIFFADGPDVQPGTQMPTFANVNIYPFISRMLALDAPKVDGKIDVLAPALIGPIRPAPVVRTEPKLISRVAAEFSEKARKKKISGTVRISFTIGTNGVPTHLHIEQGLGYGLDESAMAAVSQFRFEPATENGKAVDSQETVEVTFQTF